MSKLFLDDIRDPVHVKQAIHNGRWEEFPSIYSWTIVRSYDQFVSHIQTNGLPTMISFDHDLCYEDQNKTDYSTFKEKTGYDCAKWLAEYCLKHDLELPEYFIHSFSSVGRINIESYLKRFQEIRVDLKNSPLSS